MARLLSSQLNTFAFRGFVTWVWRTSAFSRVEESPVFGASVCATEETDAAKLSVRLENVCQTEATSRWSKLRAVCATAARKPESSVGPKIHHDEVLAARLTSVSETAAATASWGFG